VAKLGWLIITRDRHIQDNRAEIDAVRIYGAKVVNLASEDASTTWTQLEVFMTRWRRIERLAYEPGPFIYIASRTGAFRSIDLRT
jgi:PIN like domain